MARGRALNALDEESRNCVCLIDEKLMEKLFFAQDPLGQKLYIDGMEFTVVGVLATDEDRDVMAQLMGGGDNGKLIMPYTSAMRLTNMHSVTNVEVYIQDTDYTDQTVDDLKPCHNAAFNCQDDSFSRDQHGKPAGYHEHDDGRDDGPAGGHRLHFAAGGRHRHHEHDAGFRHRAHHGDRPAQGAGRAAPA